MIIVDDKLAGETAKKPKKETKNIEGTDSLVYKSPSLNVEKSPHGDNPIANMEWTQNPINLGYGPISDHEIQNKYDTGHIDIMTGSGKTWYANEMTEREWLRKHLSRPVDPNYSLLYTHMLQNGKLEAKNRKPTQLLDQSELIAYIKEGRKILKEIGLYALNEWFDNLTYSIGLAHNDLETIADYVYGEEKETV